MAVQDLDRRTAPIVASGGEILLPFGFRVLAADDVVVAMTRQDRLYVLLHGYDYSVEGVGQPDGGNIRLTRAAVAGDAYVIEGRRPHARPTDIAQQKILDARFLNHDLDSLQIQIAELRRDIAGVVSRLPADLLLPPINLPLPDPHDEYLKKLITGAYQLVGSAGQVAEDAREWANRTAEGAIRGALKDIEEGATYRAERKLYYDEQRAVADQVETLAASIGDAQAAVQIEATARASADAALSQQLTTTVAQVGAQQAAVVQVQGALVGTQADVAALLEDVTGLGLSLDGVAQMVGLTESQIAALDAQFDGLGTSLTATQGELATAQTQVQEIRAFHGIVLQAGGRTGFFRMDGTPQEVNAVFGTDKLVVVPPGGGAGIFPFVVGFINGQSTVVAGNFVADGAVVARMMAANSVQAQHIDVDRVDAVFGSFGDAQFDGKARGSTGKMVIDFDAETISGEKTYHNLRTGEWWIDA